MKHLFYAILMMSFLAGCNSSKQIKPSQSIPQIDTARTAIEHVENFLPSVFLNPKFEGAVEVFDFPPHGKLEKRLRNNLEEEDIVMFDLLQKNDTMYYVLAYSGLTDEVLATGWIYKDNNLTVDFSAYDRDLVIYRNVNDRSDKIVSDKEHLVTDVEVIDFEGDWLKIRFKYKGKAYVGWLPPEMQCANPYTTCS